MTLAPDTPLELLEEVVIAGAPGRHRHSSSCVALPDGELLVWATEATGVYPTRNGVLLQWRSLDGGRTWEPPVAAYAVPDWTAMGLAGLRRTGDTLLGFLGRLRSQAATSMADIFQESATHLARSTDGGRSWSDLGAPLGFEPGLLEVFGPGSPIRTADGLLFSACILPDATAEWYAATFLTDDAVTQLRDLRVVARTPGLQYSDIDLVRRADGALVGVIREDTPPRYGLVGVESLDEGRTWSAPWLLDIRGASHALRVLADGSIAIVYRDREEGRPGLSLAISRDGGRTYTFAGQVHAARGPFLGWPAWADLPDGTLGLVYCTAVVDGESELRFARLRDRSVG